MPQTTTVFQVCFLSKWAFQMIHVYNSYSLSTKNLISLNITIIVHLTFNKTCCEEKGVPMDCMGLCRLDGTLRSLAPPANACDRWENTTKECVIEGKANLKMIIY